MNTLLANNHELMRILRIELLAKIQKEWQDKWVEHHGEIPVLGDLCRKNAFLEELLLDVEDTLRAAIGFERSTELLISKDSLRRVLDENYVANMHLKSRNVLAIYLNYPNWQAFVARHSK